MFFSNVTIIFNKYLLDTAGFRKSISRHIFSACGNEIGKLIDRATDYRKFNEIDVLAWTHPAECT